MSTQNVEIVRGLFAYWNSREAGRSYELIAEDVEVHLAYAHGMPGFENVQRGHGAMQAFWREWLSAWDDVRVREFELLQDGDEVLGLWTQSMRGRGSDIAMEERQAAIFTLRDGKVTRIRYFNDPEQAQAEFGR